MRDPRNRPPAPAPGEQLSLLNGESDDALLFSREEATKRYTASTAEKLEIRRDCILALLGTGMPADLIAKHAHCSDRIVRLLGAKYAQVVAANTLDMVKVLRSLAMKAAFMAGQKLEEAKVGELGVLMGIALQRGQEMEMAGGALAHQEDVTIELKEEDPRRIAFIENLKRIANGNCDADGNPSDPCVSSVPETPET